MSLSEKLKNLRKQKKWTQADVSIKLATTQANISSYEVGATFPNYEMIIKMAKLFGVSSDYLLDLTDSFEGNEVSSAESYEIDLSEIKQSFKEKPITYEGKRLPKTEEEVIRSVVLSVIEREESKLRGER